MNPPIPATDNSFLESRTHQTTAGSLSASTNKPRQYEHRPTQKSLVQHPPVYEEDKPTEAQKPLVIPDMNLQSLLLNDAARETPDPFAEFAHVNYLASTNQGIASAPQAFPPGTKVLMSNSSSSTAPYSNNPSRTDRLSTGGANIIKSTTRYPSSTGATGAPNLNSTFPHKSADTVALVASLTSALTSAAPSSNSMSSPAAPSRSRSMHASGRQPASLNLSVTNGRSSAVAGRYEEEKKSNNNGASPNAPNTSGNGNGNNTLKIIPAMSHAYAQSVAAISEPSVENAFIKGKDDEKIQAFSENSPTSGKTVSVDIPIGGATQTSLNAANSSNTPSQVELRKFTSKIATMPQAALMGTCIQIFQQLLHVQHKLAKQEQEADLLKVECVALRRITGNTGKNNPEVVLLKEEKAKLCEIIESLREKVEILEKSGVRMHWELEIQKQKKIIAELSAKVDLLRDSQRMCTQLEHDKEGLNITLKSLHQSLDIQKSEIALLTQKNLELETQHVHCGPMIHQLQSQVAVLKNTQQILQDNRASLLLDHRNAKAMIQSQQQAVGTLERQLRDADLNVHQQLQVLREENSRLEQEVSSLLAENASLQRQLNQNEEKRLQLVEELNQVINLSRTATVSHLSDKRKITTILQENDSMKDTRDRAIQISDQLETRLNEARKTTSDMSQQLSQCNNRIAELESQLDVTLSALRGFVYREREDRRQIKKLLLLVMRHNLESEAVHIVRNASVSKILSYTVNEINADASVADAHQELFEALKKDFELTDRLGLTSLHSGNATGGNGTKGSVRPSGTSEGGKRGDAAAGSVALSSGDDAMPQVILQTNEERIDVVRQREQMVMNLLKMRKSVLKTKAMKLRKEQEANAELEMLRGMLKDQNKKKGKDAKTKKKATDMNDDVDLEDIDPEELSHLETTYGDIAVLFNDSDSDDDVIDVDTSKLERVRKNKSGASNSGSDGQNPDDVDDEEEESKDNSTPSPDKPKSAKNDNNSKTKETSLAPQATTKSLTVGKQQPMEEVSSTVSLRRLCRRALQHFCVQWKGDAATQTPSQAQSDITTASSAVSLVLNWTERLHSVTQASSAVAIGRLLMHYSAKALSQLRADMGVTAATLPLEGFATITHVVPGRAAAQAGVKVGDVVWSVDGVRVRGKEDLMRAVWNKRPGDVITVSVVQNGMKIVADVAAEYGEDGQEGGPHSNNAVAGGEKNGIKGSLTQGKGGAHGAKGQNTERRSSTVESGGGGSYITHSLTSLELPSQTAFLCRRAQSRALQEQVSNQRLQTYKVTLAAEGISHKGLDKLTALSNGIVYHRDAHKYQKAYKEKQRRLLNGVVGTDLDIIYGENGYTQLRNSQSQLLRHASSANILSPSNYGSNRASSAALGLAIPSTGPSATGRRGSTSDNPVTPGTANAAADANAQANMNAAIGQSVSMEHACVEVGVRAAWGNIWLTSVDGSDEFGNHSYLNDNQTLIALHNVRTVDALVALCKKVFPPVKPGGPPSVPRNYSVDENADIYLGGSCDPTTWRLDVSMPLCELHGVTYYNPQVDDWRPELVAIEAKAKEEASLLFFVIDNATRAIGSMLEAAEYIGRGRRVVVVIQEMDQTGPVKVGKDLLPPAEIKDLTRARRFLKDVAQRAGVPCYSGPDAIVLAMQDAIARCNGRVEMTAATEHDATIERLQQLGEHIMKEATIDVTSPLF